MENYEAYFCVIYKTQDLALFMRRIIAGLWFCWGFSSISRTGISFSIVEYFAYLCCPNFLNIKTSIIITIVKSIVVNIIVLIFQLSQLIENITALKGIDFTSSCNTYNFTIIDRAKPA